MTRYLVTYHGSEMPHDPELMAQAKAAFDQWAAGVGPALLDPGAPVKTITQITNSTTGANFEIGGYSIIEAADENALKEILKSHPFLSRGGILQINQILTV